MDRLEKAKLHKAIDDVMTDHHPGMRATRVMIRELILDAIEGAELKIVPATHEIDERRRKGLEAINARAVAAEIKPHPLDYGKTSVNPEDFDSYEPPYVPPAVHIKRGDYSLYEAAQDPSIRMRPDGTFFKSGS